MEAMFAFFQAQRVGEPDNILRQIGARAEAALGNNEFTVIRDANRLLTNRGYALGADLGFLVASLLAESLGDKVEWAIFRKNKRWFPHNHPVLRSRAVDCQFDMIMCSLNGCYGIIAGSDDGRFWADLFAVWRNMLLYNDTRGLSMNPAERDGSRGTRKRA
jgi:hypothetical protein